VHNHVRGLSPFPGAWFTLGSGKAAERVKVLRTAIEASSGGPGAVISGDGVVACGTGAIRLIEVQRAGKRPMPISEFLRGRAFTLGETLNTD
jgi:methionyl-tRNA formyltransferase